MNMRLKYPVMVSAMTRPEKIEIMGEGDQLKVKESGQYLEMIPIRVSNGRQCHYHTNVAAYWTLKPTKKSDWRMILTPGACTSMGSKISLLMVEISMEITREEVVEVLNKEEVVEWIQLCENAILRRESNSTRRFLRDLTRTAENTIAEVYGPSSLNIDNNPMKVNVARELQGVPEKMWQ